MSPNRNRSLAGTRTGAAAPTVMGSLFVLVIIGAFFILRWDGTGAKEKLDPVLVTVIKEEFVSKVLEQGQLRSASNVEIKCQASSVNGSVKVIDVIEEGKQVQAGDWLVTLDSTSFERELEQEQLEVSNAETTVIQAQATYDTAVASRKEYIEGLFPERQKQVLNEIYDAEQNLKMSKAVLGHNANLQKKGFITKLQLENSQIAVKRAENVLDQVTNRLRVLENITREKELIQLDSDVAAAEVQLNNAIKAKEIQERQLAEARKQLDYCKVYVPEGVSGEVVYAREDGDDRRQWVLKRGASVRERQVMILLPDLAQMEVKVIVNEQSITSIRPNMPASIRIDALNHLKLTGVVTKVNTYAEINNWMTPDSVKVYAVFVRVHNPPENINPGMNAAVSIQTQYEEAALQIPLQCIYSAGEQQFVLRKKGDEYETVEVEVDGENSTNVLIRSGLSDGDQIVMDPGAYAELFVLPEIAKESKIELPEGVELDDMPGQAETKTDEEAWSEDDDNWSEGGGDGISAYADWILGECDTDGDGQISAEEIQASDAETRGYLEEINGGEAISREDLENALREFESSQQYR